MDNIKEITKQEASNIIDTRKPLGLFYLHYNSIYVGIDNTDGHAWTEDFTTLEECKVWLETGETIKGGD